MASQSDLEEEVRILTLTIIAIKVVINKMSIAILAAEFKCQQAERPIRWKTFSKVAGKKAIKVDTEVLVM